MRRRGQKKFATATRQANVAESQARLASSETGCREERTRGLKPSIISGRVVRHFA